MLPQSASAQLQGQVLPSSPRSHPPQLWFGGRAQVPSSSSCPLASKPLPARRAAAAVPAVTAAAPAGAASNGAAQGSVKLSAVEEIRAQLAALEAKVEADRQRTVVVKGLPPNVTEKNLATFFQ